MLIFFYGKDTYRIKEETKKIILEYKKSHKSGLNLKIFNPAETKLSFDEIKKDIHQTPMFKEKKLIIIANPFFSAELKDKILEEKENLLKLKEITALIYQEGEIGGKEKLFNFLKNKAEQIKKFDLLSGQNLKNWVRNKFEEKKSKITDIAVERLCQYVGNDLWRMDNEIEKLTNFSKKTIGEKEISALTKPLIETDIFRTIDAISQKNKHRALELIHNHLKRGDSPLYLLTMINYQFRNILMVKSLIEKRQPYNTIAAKTKLHPFVVKKSYYQSKNFSLKELKNIYNKIFQTDLNIKTGRIEPVIAIELLMASI